MAWPAELFCVCRFWLFPRLALGLTVCLQLAMEQPRRLWIEQVLPYGLAELLLITPSRWTLGGHA